MTEGMNGSEQGQWQGARSEDSGFWTTGTVRERSQRGMRDEGLNRLSEMDSDELYQDVDRRQ